MALNSTMQDMYAVKLSAIWAQLKTERASFWLICVYLFLEYVRPQSIYPEIDVIPYAFVTVILAIIAYFIEGKQPRVSNIENKLIVFYLLIILLSSFFAYSPTESYKKLQLFLTWFIIYFLIINIVNTEKRFFIFFLSFMLYNFKMSQHGFISWAQIGFQFRDWGVTGAPGWFHNSGEFGIELCIFLPLSIYFVISLRQYWGRLKLLVFLLFPFTAMASVIATSSRGALVGSVAALLWMVTQSNAKAKALLAIILISIVAYSYIPPESYQRLQSSGEDKTSQHRLERWKVAREIMAEYPVLGIGYANWMTYYKAFYPQKSPGLPHNIFFDAGAELGYTGLLVFLMLILYTFINNSRTRKMALKLEDNFSYYIAHGLDAAMIGFMVSGSFVSVLYYPFFWINLSFTVALNNIVSQRYGHFTTTSSA